MVPKSFLSRLRVASPPLALIIVSSCVVISGSWDDHQIGTTEAGAGAKGARVYEAGAGAAGGGGGGGAGAGAGGGGGGCVA